MKTISRGKSFFATALAAIMLTLTCGTAYSDSNVSTSVSYTELTDIGGYACYQRDGNYWTVIDGEEYLVIDTRNLVTSSVAPIATYSQNASIGTPPSWGNTTYVSLPDGTSYTDNVYIKSGDYYSPIFEVTPKMTDFRFKFDTNHILSYTYDMIFWYHFQSPLNEWHSEPKKITFSGIPGYKIIMPGTMSGIIDGVGIEINSANSDQKNFKYTITPQ